SPGSRARRRAVARKPRARRCSRSRCCARPSPRAAPRARPGAPRSRPAARGPRRRAGRAPARRRPQAPALAGTPATARLPPSPRILHRASRMRTLDRRMRAARVSIPIALTAGIVAITIALTVGWQILVVRESLAFTAGFKAIHWVLIVLGSLFFALIISVLILQAVWLGREIPSHPPR